MYVIEIIFWFSFFKPNQYRLWDMSVYFSKFSSLVLESSGYDESSTFICFISVTPLDVVKIRLQAQTKGFVKGECFIYCNGLMDHVCTCLNGDPATAGSQAKLWKRVPHQQFTGMMVFLLMFLIAVYCVNILYGKRNSLKVRTLA